MFRAKISIRLTVQLLQLAKLFFQRHLLQQRIDSFFNLLARKSLRAYDGVGKNNDGERKPKSRESRRSFLSVHA